MAIIGRIKECRELLRLTESDSSEFVAIYGRRRVGKTFLVREFYKQQFTFYASGICRGDRITQLKCFQDALVEYGYYGIEQLPNRSILVTMITSNGLKHNEHSSSMVQNELSLESLFEA